ncbi:purine-nucleoside phosphorylase [Pseudochrobactrum sp. MP213Fo]|uniref:purine-nucleoside phosphorylase n=1 Tax=Pseudochrobactrum sp. MP213Fo TaxID=3022250 RepID=UPI003B9E37A2
MRALQIAACGLLPLFSATAFAQDTAKIAPKVMVITMFGQEAKPWIEGEKFTQKIKLAGLNPEYPNVDCTEEGLCHMTTAMGFANAASSVAAMALSNQFDLSKTYFLIAGIAGVDPKFGTLGSAHWAKYAVDADLNHRIDLREVPADWETRSFALGADSPSDKAKWSAGTEAYALNAKLTDYAFSVTKDVELLDGDGAKAYRKHYKTDLATGAPLVSICDTLSSDTYWHGIKISESMEKWVKLATDGKGTYCTSQMEDNATLTALKRASEAGLLDFNRIALLRTSSNFDRQGEDQTALESLKSESGGFKLATTNAYRVGKAYVQTILTGWDKWQEAPQTETAQ